MSHTTKRASAKDVAKLAGVSTATVSRALNDHPAISQKTKQVVRDACQALHYVPAISVRSLFGYKSNTIGAIIPDISNPYFASVCAAIEHNAAAQGYQVLFINTFQDIDRETAAVHRLLSQQVDGILISAASPQSPAILSPILDGLPCVYIGGNHDSLCSYVEGDNEQGAYEATQYLFHLGHRKIYFIGGRYGTRTLELRLNGYRRSMLQSNLSPREIIPPDDIIDHNQWLLGEIQDIFRKGILPDAFLVYSDIDAIHILDIADQAGFHMPKDFSIVSFDDIPISQLSLFGLTSVTMHKSLLGEIAFNRLYEKIYGKNQQTIDILQPELIIRSSCRKLG